ncbi:MAG: coenzyme F420-0:L-glutamate ligase [Acidimicrobiia bacterium]|nr:coenzyme F420-0:L-glutamate ligase [Acidimicrobiia bacterium]
MGDGPPFVAIHPVMGIGEVEPGDDLAAMIVGAVGDLGIVDRDIVVVTHKVVSKAEGQIREIPDEPTYRALVESEAVNIVRRRGDLVIAQTRHGFICANAAVDRSNTAAGTAILLPVDPDRSAHRLRRRIEQATGASIGVVITDTFGRPWRRGLTDVAIGISGLPSVVDYRGTSDTHGNTLEVTEVAAVDEIASAADLVMGKATGIPVAVVRGLDLVGDGRVTDLVRPADEDLFR